MLASKLVAATSLLLIAAAITVGCSAAVQGSGPTAAPSTSVPLVESEGTPAVPPATEATPKTGATSTVAAPASRSASIPVCGSDVAPFTEATLTSTPAPDTCSFPIGGASRITDYPGLPQNAGTLANGPTSGPQAVPGKPPVANISAAWTRTHELAIVLRGGSYCYPTATSLINIGLQRLQVDQTVTLPYLESSLPPGVVGGCPAMSESAPHTTIWKPPASLNVHRPVVIVLKVQGYHPDDSVTLPGL